MEELLWTLSFVEIKYVNGILVAGSVSCFQCSTLSYYLKIETEVVSETLPSIFYSENGCPILWYLLPEDGKRTCVRHIIYAFIQTADNSQNKILS